MNQAFELIDHINIAFANVKRPQKTLDQCFITDEFGIGGLSDEEFNRRYENAGKIRPYDNWTDIPKELIEKFDPPFFNMSNEELVFYLPAYMVYVLKNLFNEPKEYWWEHKVLLNVAYYLGVDHDYDSFEYLYSSMSKQQKIVVLEYATFIVDLTYSITKDKDFFANFQKKSWHEYHLETVLRAKNTLFRRFNQYLEN